VATTLTTTEENKALLRRYYQEAWQEGRVEVLAELFSPAFIDHHPDQRPPTVGNDHPREIAQEFRAALPDLQITVEDLIAVDDKGVGRVIVSGTDRGGFMGAAPSGRRVSVSAIDIVRIAGGQAVEHWGNQDMLGLLQQLGALPIAPNGH
jgi:predicted ester cyclase